MNASNQRGLRRCKVSEFDLNKRCAEHSRGRSLDCAKSAPDDFLSLEMTKNMTRRQIFQVSCPSVRIMLRLVQSHEALNESKVRAHPSQP
jgi:hypothetical protein